MPKFTVRAFENDDAFAFGATLYCQTSIEAVRRFNALPLAGRRAELRLGSRLIASRRDDLPAEHNGSRAGSSG